MRPHVGQLKIEDAIHQDVTQGVVRWQKAKVIEVEEDKNRLETMFESVERELNKAQEGIKTLNSKSSDSKSAFMELEDKLFSTHDELLEITDVAARCEWECEEMRKEYERECLKAKNELYKEMQTAHKKKLDAQDELICL